MASSALNRARTLGHYTASGRPRRLNTVGVGTAASVLFERFCLNAGRGPPVRQRLRTGIRAIERWRWWGVIPLLGRGGIGKTALAARIALETGLAGGRTLWLAMDGHAEVPVLRTLSGLAGVPYRRCVTGAFDDDERSRLRRAAARLRSFPGSIVEAHGGSMPDVAQIVAKSSRRHRPDIVIVDGLTSVDLAQLLALDDIAEAHDTPVLAAITTAEEQLDAKVTTLHGASSQLRSGGMGISLRAAAFEDSASLAGSYRPLLLTVHRSRMRDPIAVEARLQVDYRLTEVTHTESSAPERSRPR